MNVGLIIIKRDYSDAIKDLLEHLDLPVKMSNELVHIDEVLSPGYSNTAIGFLNGNTIILNHSLPYDCTPLFYKYSDLDENLMRISKEAEVLCTYAHTTSGVYGHALYLKGKKVKCRAYQENEIERDEFDPELPEIYKSNSEQDEETYYNNFNKVFMGYTIRDLLFNQDFRLMEFE
ncbi:MAG: hypothetical protein QNJ57_07705 [Flavobacteriaceae bacterium]|nr:hypothetical protein [Flavobacteriaceae bacterium]